jgi:hypothetical protein
VCFVLIRVVFSAPFNRARIHLFFQFSKPIPDFQLSKRSRNHEINPQKEGLIFEDFDQPQKQCVKTNKAKSLRLDELWARATHQEAALGAETRRQTRCSSAK